MKDFTLADERYLRELEGAFKPSTPLADYADAIKRLERAGYAIVQLTRERDRAQRGIRCGACVSGILMVLALAGWGLWLFR